jgi:hypothetical protein
MECDPVIGPVIDPATGFVIESDIDPVIECDPVIDMAELLDSGIAAKSWDSSDFFASILTFVIMFVSLFTIG